MSERDDLILSLGPQVMRIANAIYRPALRLDMIQAAWIGAIQAVDGFVPGSAQLKTYADKRIRGAVLDFLRREPLVSGEQSGSHRDSLRVTRARLHWLDMEAHILEKRAAEDSGEYQRLQLAIIPAKVVRGLDSVLEHRAPDNGDVLRIDARLTFEKLARNPDITPRELQVLRLYYFGQMGMGKIAARLGVDQSRVSQIRIVAIRKLKAAA